MADSDAELDYPYIAQNALRGVVRDVLSITEAMGGPPGDHHFYVEFLTGAPDVEISAVLRGQYPDRMTIVLQHQFENLVVGDGHFEVTLYFKGTPEHLSIPYDAIVQFMDPSVNFALQFPSDAIDLPVDEDEEPDENAPSAEIEQLAPRARDESDDGDDDPDAPPPAASPDGGSADVVSLDRFRKK